MRPMSKLKAISFSVPIGIEYYVSFVAIGVTVFRDRKTGLDWGTVRRLKMMDISRC